MSAQFHEKPHGHVILWRVCDRCLKHKIENVYGFDAATGFWLVSIIKDAEVHGSWSGTETVQIVRAGNEWLLAPTEHQHPAEVPA